MKPIQKSELYGHLSGFLRSRGVDLKEGSYSQAIQRSCGILADVVNLGQQGLDRAKTELDKNLERMRQSIHEKTAPKSPPTAASAAGAASAAEAPKSASRKPGTKIAPASRKRPTKRSPR